MPTLFRFVTILLVVAAVIYASMLALATLVVPRQRVMEIPVPIDSPAKQEQPK